MATLVVGRHKLDYYESHYIQLDWTEVGMNGVMSVVVVVGWLALSEKGVNASTELPLQ